ncbi:MAG: hypothetical protein DMF42_06990 [Verrucomicrobia bacterium]|nr:MAG: hypothetical protein DMF42_06990 [Verrucomicrobiota bacterium]
MPLGAAQRRPGNRRNRRLNQRQFVELYFTRGVATFHHRADGTYVAPHYQTNPNHNPYDNWSTKGNYNPSRDSRAL